MFYGLDFGTSNSVLSYVNEDGKVETFNLYSDKGIINSVIYFNKSDFYIGQKAIDEYKNDCLNQQFDGRIIQSLKKALGENNLLTTSIYGNQYTLVDLISLYLERIRNDFQSKTGETINNIVLGKPVEFDGSGPQANEIATKRLKRAAKKAGFKHIEFEYEPVGAGTYYQTKTETQQGIILVIDFGGGTLDFSLIKLPSGEIIDVLGLVMGGTLLTESLFDYYFLKYFGKNIVYGKKNLSFPNWILNNLSNKKTVKTLRTSKFYEYLNWLEGQIDEKNLLNNIRYYVDKNLGYTFFDRVDKHKIVLSQKEQVDFEFNNGPISIHEILKRKTLEEQNKWVWQEIDHNLDEFFANNNLDKQDINKVIVTGGAAQTPRFKKIINNKFPQDKILNEEIFTAVSKGLALKAKEKFS